MYCVAYQRLAKSTWPFIYNPRPELISALALEKLVILVLVCLIVAHLFSLYTLML